VSHVYFRYCGEKDIRAIRAIERESFSDPWSESDFYQFFNYRSTFVAVVEVSREIAGYVAGEMLGDEVRVVGLAIHPAFRGQGLGRVLVERMKSDCEKYKRKRVVLEVPERNLAAQKFFRACGLVAYAVLRGFDQETGEDAFAFRWSVIAADEVIPATPTRRVIL
jgi:ribosomal-protein-alanine N-acetyltransferase